MAEEKDEKKTAKPVKDMSFEEALNELEQIVAQLQNGDIPLKESMESFQRGIELANYCSQSLDDAEETMTKLMTDSGELKDLDEDDVDDGEKDS